MPVNKKDLTRYRKPTKFVLPSTADEAPENQIVVEYETGMLDYPQTKELEAYAKQIVAAGPRKGETVWLTNVAEARIPFVVLEHASTKWNYEVLSIPGVDDSPPIALDLQEAEIAKHVPPSDLSAFGALLWRDHKETLGVGEGNEIANPLALMGSLTPNDDSTSTDTSPSEDSQAPSTEPISLSNGSLTPMNSTEADSPFPLMEGSPA